MKRRISQRRQSKLEFRSLMRRLRNIRAKIAYRASFEFFGARVYPAKLIARLEAREDAIRTQLT